MDGFYTTTLERVKQARQPLGLIISEDRVDIACIVVAVATFLTSHPVSDLVLMIAAAYQTAGWFISVRLPEKK